MGLSGVAAKLFYDTSGGNPKAYVEMLLGEKSLEKLPICRPDERHRSFILSTWVRSYEPMARRVVTSGVYNSEEARVAERLWDRSWIVTSPDDDYTVHGWVCGRTAADAGPGVLHHCYVVPQLRHRGVAKALISHACGRILQYVRPWPWKAPNGWTFNPYLIGGQ
jgi:GNAT superfamily N-acetyltransferase